MTRPIVLIAYDGCQMLDVSGPWEVFAKASRLSGTPAYRLHLASPRGGAITTNGGLTLAGSTALARLRGPLDTVLVAGGDVDAVETAPDARALLHPWLRRRVRDTRRVGSICTGAFALAAAGLLDGRTATTHWQSCERLARSYPRVAVQPDALFVHDGALHTSAGITAGMDLALALVEADWGGALAVAVARELVLHLRRPGGQSQYSAGLQAQALAADGDRLAALIHAIGEHPERNWSLPELARYLAVSERHVGRLFAAGCGKTPARLVAALRLERAKQHLQGSTWPLARVAQRAGLGSVDSLRRALKRQCGLTPEAYRARFGPPGR